MSTTAADVTPVEEAKPVVEAEAPAAAEEVKAEVKPAEAPANSAEIVKQVEFYFGDSNLTKPDKFLVGLIKSGTQGFVDLSVISKFKRMEELIPSKDVQILAAALRTSANPLLEVSEDGTLVRRSPTCPLPKENLYNKRSVYTKGWDLETTKDERPIRTYFEGKGYVVLSVRLRKALHTHEFKGSAFVELKDVDEAMKAAKEEFEVEGGNKLEVEMKEAYHARKKAERAKNKAEKKAASGESEGGGAKEEVAEEPFEKGCILKFSGVPDDTSREDFKEAFGKFSEVSWVDFQRGDTEGEVRFAGPDAATVVEKCVAEEVKINGVLPVLTVVDGEDEEAYWKKVAASRKEARSRKSGKGRGKGKGKGKGKGRGRGGGKRGRGGDRGNKRSRDDDGDGSSAAKRTKDE